VRCHRTSPQALRAGISFIALRVATISVFTPPAPSGTSIGVVESSAMWSSYCASSGRPLMPFANVVAALEEFSEPKRSSEDENQKLR